VEITLPHEFIVAATGWCTNEAKVMPDSLKEKLRLENFKDKPFGEKPSTLIEPEAGKTKTWKFWATNVHDFAWTADPTYRIGEAEWNGIRIFSYAREWKAAKWQDAAQFTAEVIRVYSTDFGPYGYWKMIVADADQGMEYPMLTLDGGVSPNYYGLFAHEVGHNWFYGMVGNNETYRAFLDEGFTNFIGSWSMERLVRSKDKPGAENFAYHNNEEQDRLSNYQVYTSAVRNGYDAPLNLHTDNYDVASGTSYSNGLVYFKTAVMLYNLQYTLGDELFRRAFSAYFNSWKFRHPYPEDFRDAISRYTKWDLSWFFDQWLDRIWELDYAMENVKSRKTSAGYETTATLRRKGKMIMPIDLVFYLEDGSQQKAIIPVGEQVKDEPGAVVLPKWYSMTSELNRTYDATVTLPRKAARVEIDPSGRLADAYRLDNRSGFLPKQKWAWALADPDFPLDAYLVKWRPDIWFNDVDGLRLGVNLDGAYLNPGGGNGDRQIELTPRFGGNVPDRPLSYFFRYQQPLRRLGNGAIWKVQSSISAGLARHSVGFSQDWRRSPFESTGKQLDLQWRFEKLYDPNYLAFSGSYDTAVNNQLRIRFSQTYHHQLGNGSYAVQLNNSAPGNPNRFSKITLTSLQDITISEQFSLRWRIFAGYISGQAPNQSMLYLSNGSPEDWIENNWYAARGTLPTQWAHDGRIQPAGGGNVRGYQIDRRYPGNGQSPNSQMFLFSGNRLLATNLEVDFPSLVNPLIEIVPGLLEYFSTKMYLFFDAGSIDVAAGDDVIGLNTSPLADAGIGAIGELELPGALRNLGALQVRFDFPFYLSDPPPGENNFEFRWLMGIGRTF
jgi:aminopeptidase N